jgi:hypothetical protein
MWKQPRCPSVDKQINFKTMEYYSLHKRTEKERRKEGREGGREGGRKEGIRPQKDLEDD